MDQSAVPAPAVPSWLPLWLEGIWLPLARYPLLLALVVLATGLLLAVLARALILYWGLKLTARTRTSLDERLVRLLAGTGMGVMVYASIIAALQVLPLPPTLATVLVRLLVTMLLLHIMRAALRGSHLMLLAVSEIRDRFSIVEERTIPLFDLIFTVLIVGIAARCSRSGTSMPPPGWLPPVYSASRSASRPRTRWPTCSPASSSLRMRRTRWAITSCWTVVTAAR